MVIHAQIPQAVIPTCRRATKPSGEHAIRCASRNFDRKSLLHTPFETACLQSLGFGSCAPYCSANSVFFPCVPARFNMNSHPARTLNRKLPIKIPNLRYRMPKTSTLMIHNGKFAANFVCNTNLQPTSVLQSRFVFENCVALLVGSLLRYLPSDPTKGTRK